MSLELRAAFNATAKLPRCHKCMLVTDCLSHESDPPPGRSSGPEASAPSPVVVAAAAAAAAAAVAGGSGGSSSSTVPPPPPTPTRDRTSPSHPLQVFRPQSPTTTQHTKHTINQNHDKMSQSGKKVRCRCRERPEEACPVFSGSLFGSARADDDVSNSETQKFFVSFYRQTVKTLKKS
jgi:hypothetical protein